MMGGGGACVVMWQGAETTTTENEQALLVFGGGSPGVVMWQGVESTTTENEQAFARFRWWWSWCNLVVVVWLVLAAAALENGHVCSFAWAVERWWRQKTTALENEHKRSFSRAVRGGGGDRQQPPTKTGVFARFRGQWVVVAADNNHPQKRTLSSLLGVVDLFNQLVTSNKKKNMAGAPCTLLECPVSARGAHVVTMLRTLTCHR